MQHLRIEEIEEEMKIKAGEMMDEKRKKEKGKRRAKEGKGKEKRKRDPTPGPSDKSGNYNKSFMLFSGIIWFNLTGSKISIYFCTI